MKVLVKRLVTLRNAAASMEYPGAGIGSATPVRLVTLFLDAVCRLVDA